MLRPRDKRIVKLISDTIRKVRHEKGLTQEDFLFEVGIHLGRIEMGNRDMSVTTLIAICCKLEIPVANFFCVAAKQLEKMDIDPSFFADPMMQDKMNKTNNE